jgi:hypothetical protein
MKLDDWLRAAQADADRRGLAELQPMIDTLVRATRALRQADWNADPQGDAPATPGPSPAST